MHWMADGRDEANELLFIYVRWSSFLIDFLIDFYRLVWWSERLHHKSQLITNIGFYAHGGNRRSNILRHPTMIRVYGILMAIWYIINLITCPATSIRCRTLHFHLLSPRVIVSSSHCPQQWLRIADNIHLDGRMKEFKWDFMASVVVVAFDTKTQSAANWFEFDDVKFVVRNPPTHNIIIHFVCLKCLSSFS